MSSARSLTVGAVPVRRGVWLGYQEGVTYTPLAKFRNQEAADLFLAVLRTMARHREVFTFEGDE
jgi:hypothetical protein